jgi:hypothetical protein
MTANAQLRTSRRADILAKMMEAARLKRARRRMRGYFLGSGIILAFLYILAAAFVVSVLGVELTRFWSTVLMAAAVLLGGSYGIILFSSIGIHAFRRLLNRQPIMDAED